MQTRIGIFGGTFNPVHIGHLIAAQDAIEAMGLAKVLFVPCNMPAHKTAARLVSAEHRVAMLEKAIEDNPDFELCDLEILQGGVNYSIDTVRRLREIYPGRELFFIVGSDSLADIHRWKDIQELVRLCRFLVLTRPGYAPPPLPRGASRPEDAVARAILENTAAMHQVDISSTDIRHRLAEGMSIRYLVPPGVEMYIAEHNLYR